MSAERTLALQQAATHAAGSSLDSLLTQAELSLQNDSTVIVQDAVPRAKQLVPSAARQPAQPGAPAVATRPNPQPTLWATGRVTKRPRKDG